MARVGKMPTTAVRRLISLLSRSWGVRAEDLAAVRIGKREVDEEIGLGADQQLGDGREAGREAIDDTPQQRCLYSQSSARDSRTQTRILSGVGARRSEFGP